MKEENNFMVEYKDRNGKVIKEGDTIRFLQDNSEELVYKTDSDDLGINASNDKFLGYNQSLRRFIYPLSNFDLKQVEIIKQNDK
jgi:hypothetical protein